MGTIMLTVPEDIHMEYQIDSLKMMAPLLEWLKNSQNTKQPIENKDKLLGLFADDAELIDQITELQARENHPLRWYSEIKKNFVLDCISIGRILN